MSTIKQKRKDVIQRKPIEIGGSIMRKTEPVISKARVREKAAGTLTMRNAYLASQGIDVPTETPTWVKDLHYFENC